MSNAAPFVLNLPHQAYLPESEVAERLKSYETDISVNSLVNFKAAEIKKILLSQINKIAHELALFDVAVLTRKGISNDLEIINPSFITWIQ